MEGRELRFEDALRYQGPMRKPIGEEPKRTAFMSDLQCMKIDELEGKWAQKPSAKLLMSKYIWGNRQKVALWEFRKKLFSKVHKER